MAVIVAASVIGQPAASHDKAYWRAIASARFEVPAGETAQRLAPELVASLGSTEYARLLDAALAYLHDERDTRGFDPRRGWMHSVAHTSDLLKFLARNPRLPAPGQARILSALIAKIRETPAPFSQGEDERMARVAISIARRADFDRDGFRSWLGTAKSASAFPNPATVDALRAQQNIRHLLMALWTELSVDERPSEGADFAKAALREVLKGLF